MTAEIAQANKIVRATLVDVSSNLMQAFNSTGQKISNYRHAVAQTASGEKVQGWISKGNLETIELSGTFEAHVLNMASVDFDGNNDPKIYTKPSRNEFQGKIHPCQNLFAFIVPTKDS